MTGSDCTYREANDEKNCLLNKNPVSYTHLDVYKRQSVLFTCNDIHVLTHPQLTTKACDLAGKHQGKYCRRRVYLRDVGKCAQMSKSICVKVSV